MKLKSGASRPAKRFAFYTLASFLSSSLFFSMLVHPYNAFFCEIFVVHVLLIVEYNVSERFLKRDVMKSDGRNKGVRNLG